MSDQENSRVPGQLEITIYKTQQVAAISGGDFGPGEYNDMGTFTYKWTLPVNSMLPEYSPVSEIKELTEVVNYIVETVFSVAQSSIQSANGIGVSGEYDGEMITLSAEHTDENVTGQLQSNGLGIDISGVTSMKNLFINNYTAAPDNATTKRSLLISIVD